MPTRAPRLCGRCHNTYTGKRCLVCEERRAIRQPVGTARRTDYKSARWIRESRQYLVDHPLCDSAKHRDLPEYMRPLARNVDHIDGLGLQGPRAWDQSNWQGLCISCHSAKTAKYDRGFGNKPKRRPDSDGPAPF